MSKSVLVTGATGLLGREVVDAFRTAGWNVIGTGFTRAKPPAILKVDLGNQAEIVKALDEVKPQVVVHCAANRMPDKCDADPEGTKAINVQATQALVDATQSRSMVLIYISTDYVFPGVEGEAPYEATSPTSPPNLYGQTKLDGEKAVLSTTAQSGLGAVLRIPVLYGKVDEAKESSINVLMDSLWKAQDKDANVTVDDWSIRYPTNTEDVARVIKDVAATYLDSSDKTSLPHVLQFSSEDRMTKYQICELFAAIMGLPIDGMAANKQGNDPDSQTQRPYDCHLSTAELRKLGISVQTQDFAAWWRREVRAYRK